LFWQAIKLRGRQGAVPQFFLIAALPALADAVPMRTSLSAEACGNLMGCSLKQFFSPGIISMGMGARHDRS